MTPLYIACYKGHNKIVQLLLDHGVQMDVPDKVSNITCIHVKLCNTTEINNDTWAQKNKNEYDNVFMKVLNLL